MIGPLHALLGSRLSLWTALGCVVLIPLCVWTAYGWGVAHRDFVREEGRAKGLYAEIHAEGLGYKDRLTTCQASLRGHEAALSIQSAEVDRLAREGKEATQRAAEAVRRAEANAQRAERRVQAILSSQPQPDEGRCEAALRLIQETVR